MINSPIRRLKIPDVIVHRSCRYVGFVYIYLCVGAQTWQWDLGRSLYKLRKNLSPYAIGLYLYPHWMGFARSRTSRWQGLIWWHVFKLLSPARGLVMSLANGMVGMDCINSHVHHRGRELWYICFGVSRLENLGYWISIKRQDWED